MAPEEAQKEEAQVLSQNNHEISVLCRMNDFESHHREPNPDFVKVPLTRTQFFAVYLSLAAAVFLVAMDLTIISTAIPAIAQEFNSLDKISWIGSAYFLTSTAFTPIYGSLCDIFGRKFTFMLAIALFEAGSLLCGAAPSMNTLIGGRLIAGIGGSIKY